MKLPLIFFAVILLLVVLTKWYKNRPVKESAPAKTDTSKKKKTFPFGTIITLIILAAIGWFGYRYFTGLPTRQQAPAVAQQEWQLCWMKKPEYEGKTDIRQKCLPARIETRSDSYIVISYSFSGGKGVREGTSTDGNNYSGQWKDKTGWGNFHMKFVSPDTAFGWSDDEGAGDKQPSVFERKT